MPTEGNHICTLTPELSVADVYSFLILFRISDLTTRSVSSLLEQDGRHLSLADNRDYLVYAYPCSVLGSDRLRIANQIADEWT